MTDRQFLALAHLLLFVLQLATATMVILISPEFVALNVIISGFQSKLPAFPKMGEQ